MNQRIILLIEDEADIAKVVAKRLSTAGYKVVTKPDASLGILEANKMKPDLIILDLMQPGGSGLEVLERLNFSTKTKMIPVLVLTGLQDEAKKQIVMKQGVAGYLEKPYEPKGLITEVKRILGD